MTAMIDPIAGLILLPLAWASLAFLAGPGRGAQLAIGALIIQLALAILLAVEVGDTLAILSAGAYGMAMASNYNTRPRAAEVMVDGPRVHLIREREEVRTLFAGERLL